MSAPFAIDALLKRWRECDGGRRPVTMADLRITDALDNVEDSRRSAVALELVRLTHRYAGRVSAEELRKVQHMLPSSALMAIADGVSFYDDPTRALAQDVLQTRLLAISIDCSDAPQPLP